MMTPKQRRNIIIILSLILLLIFLWLLSFLLPKAQPKAEKAPVVENSIAPKQVASPYTTEQLQQEKQSRVEASSVITLSKLFTERFGSYSNEANFQNIRDVIPLMSKKFAAATEKDLATKAIPVGIYGITTRVITVNVILQDEASGTAITSLSAQRVEEKGSAQNPSTKYQDIRLMFVREAGVWKIDSADWQ